MNLNNSVKSSPRQKLSLKYCVKHTINLSVARLHCLIIWKDCFTEITINVPLSGRLMCDVIDNENK